MKHRHPEVARAGKCCFVFSYECASPVHFLQVTGRTVWLEFVPGPSQEGQPTIGMGACQRCALDLDLKSSIMFLSFFPSNGSYWSGREPTDMKPAF